VARSEQGHSLQIKGECCDCCFHAYFAFSPPEAARKGSYLRSIRLAIISWQLWLKSYLPPVGVAWRALGLPVTLVRRDTHLCARPRFRANGGQPGVRAPHVWVDRAGKRISTTDPPFRAAGDGAPRPLSIPLLFDRRRRFVDDPSAIWFSHLARSAFSLVM
jgi:hypothetical protein